MPRPWRKNSNKALLSLFSTTTTTVRRILWIVEFNLRFEQILRSIILNFNIWHSNIPPPRYNSAKGSWKIISVLGYFSRIMRIFFIQTETTFCMAGILNLVPRWYSSLYFHRIIVHFLSYNFSCYTWKTKSAQLTRKMASNKMQKDKLSVHFNFT